jgi:hypothetical protein
LCFFSNPEWVPVFLLQEWELPEQEWELPEQEWELPEQEWELPEQEWASHRLELEKSERE